MREKVVLTLLALALVVPDGAEFSIGTVANVTVVEAQAQEVAAEPSSKSKPSNKSNNQRGKNKKNKKQKNKKKQPRKKTENVAVATPGTPQEVNKPRIAAQSYPLEVLMLVQVLLTDTELSILLGAVPQPILIIYHVDGTITTEAVTPETLASLAQKRAEHGAKSAPIPDYIYTRELLAGRYDLLKELIVNLLEPSATEEFDAPSIRASTVSLPFRAKQRTREYKPGSKELGEALTAMLETLKNRIIKKAESGADAQITAADRDMLRALQRAEQELAGAREASKDVEGATRKLNDLLKTPEIARLRFDQHSAFSSELGNLNKDATFLKELSAAVSRAVDSDVSISAVVPQEGNTSSLLAIAKSGEIYTVPYRSLGVLGQPVYINDVQPVKGNFENQFDWPASIALPFCRLAPPKGVPSENLDAALCALKTRSSEAGTACSVGGIADPKFKDFLGGLTRGVEIEVKLNNAGENVTGRFLANQKDINGNEFLFLQNGEDTVAIPIRVISSVATAVSGQQLSERSVP